MTCMYYTKNVIKRYSKNKINYIPLKIADISPVQEYYENVKIILSNLLE